LLRHLLAASQSDDELQRAFWNNWIQLRRDQGAEILQRAVQRGELRAGVNVDALIDSVFGAVYYRLAIPYAPLDDAYVAILIDQVFLGVLTHPKG
jgi:hypothetical protein